MYLGASGVALKYFTFINFYLKNISFRFALKRTPNILVSHANMLHAPIVIHLMSS